MDSVTTFNQIREAQRETRYRLRNYMNARGIKASGCTIYGDDGPVWYETIASHPKVRGKMGLHK